MSYSNGKITAPIAASDPYYVMGVGTYNGGYDIGYICSNQHGKINRWSKNKPIIYDTPSEIGESERIFANYGFDMNYAEDIYLPNLFDKAQENPEWVYLAPQSGNWLRLLDFDGYNHNATEPYSYSSFPTTINTVNNTAEIQFRILKNSTAEIDINKFGYFDSHQTSFKYALACRKKGTSDIYLYYGNTISEANNEILIDVTFPSTGVWELLFVATRETTLEPLNLNTVYMPLGYNTVEVKKVVSYALTKITSTFTLEFTYDGIIKGFSPINLNVKAVNEAISTTTARFLLHVHCYSSSNKIVGDFIVDDETGNFVYNGSSEQTYSLDYLYGSFIAISAYDPSIFIEEVTKVEVVAELKTIEGYGVMIFDKEYKWVINKSQ